MDAIRKWLDIAYSVHDLKCPGRIELANSPEHAFSLEKELTGYTSRCLDACGIADSGWVGFYDFFHRIGVLSNEEASDVLALREFQRSAWDTILLDECAIVVLGPKLLKRDANGNLHNSTGPCIEWQDGQKAYAWHGVWIPDRIIVDPKSYTGNEYLALSTEVRRALGEKAGWDHVSQLLGAKPIDTWTDPITGLTYELLASDNGKWLKKQSPVLKTGQQPYYIEPVHEDLQTAQAARKWQATDLTPGQCETDPKLTYDVET
jgi:hypothetical protein